MFILRDLLRPLQDPFSDTDLGRERASLFVYTLLAVIVPFTSSMTSNILRSLIALFGIEIKKKRFYTFILKKSVELGVIIGSVRISGAKPWYYPLKSFTHRVTVSAII